MTAVAFLWTLLFSWMPTPLAILSVVLLVVSVIALFCRILKFVWDAIPFL